MDAHCNMETHECDSGDNVDSSTPRLQASNPVLADPNQAMIIAACTWLFNTCSTRT